MVIGTRSNISLPKSGDEVPNDSRRNRGKLPFKTPAVEEMLVEDNPSCTHEESEEHQGEDRNVTKNPVPERFDMEVVAKFITQNQESFFQFVRKNQEVPKVAGEERQGSSRPASQPRQERGRLSRSP